MYPRCSNSSRSPGRDLSDPPPLTWVAISDTSRPTALWPWPVNDCILPGSPRYPQYAPIRISRVWALLRLSPITLLQGSSRRDDNPSSMWHRRMKERVECMKHLVFASAGSSILLSSSRRRAEKRRHPHCGGPSRRIDLGPTVASTRRVDRSSTGIESKGNLRSGPWKSPTLESTDKRHSMTR
jgi:hypothetical protein